VSGNVSYSHNTIDQVRHNVGGVAGLNADADFDADQYGLYVEAGHDIPLFSKTIFSPKALMNYQHLSIDDYSEKGAGGAGLDVESDDLDVFEIGLGAEVSWDFITDSGARLRPSLNTGYRYDLIGDSIDATSTFIAGGSAFSTDGVDPAQGTFNVGAAISYAMDDNWELSADYGVEVKDEYNSHTGHIRADYKF
jgi:outer membrane autotransporter protein